MGEINNKSTFYNKNLEDEYPNSLTANTTLGLLILAYILSFIDRQVMGVLIGPIKADLDITDTQFSLLQGTAFAVMYTVMGLPFGRMADSKSRRVIISLGVAGWSLMTLLCGVAKNYTQMLAVRMGVGIGEAALSPAAYSMITDLYPRDKVIKPLAFYKAAVPIGSGLAFLFGGALYEYYDSLGRIELPLMGEIAAWQATFISLSIPGFLLAFVLMFIKEPSRKGLIKDSNNTVNQISIKDAFAYFKLNKHMYGTLIGGCSMFAIGLYSNTSWFTEMILRNFDIGRAEAGATFGILYIISGILGVMMAPFISSYLESRGHTDAVVRTMFYMAVLCIPFGIIAPLMPTATLSFACITVMMLCSAVYLGLSVCALQLITPNQLRGQVSAIYLFATNMLGLVFGSSVVALFTDFVFGRDDALHYSLSICALIFFPLAAFILYRNLKHYRKAIIDANEWV